MSAIPITPSAAAGHRPAARTSHLSISYDHSGHLYIGYDHSCARFALFIPMELIERWILLA
jgi:hypothetical protein